MNEITVKKVCGKTYKIHNGIFYDKNTPDNLCRILSECKRNNTRIKIYYGDTKTGKLWLEENDIFGYIGRSTGIVKIPLLIYNSRSAGGGGILSHCILRIENSSNGHLIYQNPVMIIPEYQINQSNTPGYKFELVINGELHAQLKTLKSANNLVNLLGLNIKKTW